MFQATNQSWQLEHGLNMFPANQTFAHPQNVGIFKKQPPLLREDYRYLLSLKKSLDKLQGSFKVPHPRKTIYSIGIFNKQPLPLREDYRYLLSLQKILDKVQES